MQEVKIWVCMSGDYGAWNEIRLRVEYDVTNNIQLDDMSLEEIEAWDSSKSEYGDYELRDGVLYNGKYYLGL